MDVVPDLTCFLPHESKEKLSVMEAFLDRASKWGRQIAARWLFQTARPEPGRGSLREGTICGSLHFEMWLLPGPHGLLVSANLWCRGVWLRVDRSNS